GINPHHFVYIAKNIVENAIKFSDKNTPTIQVLLKKKSDKWVLQVKDNGIGIPKDDVTSVTKRFYRSKNATGLEGTGLGLSIVAKFVDVYKGSLQITSSVNKGTIVTVTI
ncbi:ATP-binding protein, partial [bacterium]|nr:ATP-binding protein [bacterium]